MPIRRAQKLTAWSYSRLTTYEACPLLARFKFIDRLREPPSKPLERGQEVHTKAEKYSTGELKKRPKELDLFKEEFKALRRIKKKLNVEQELAITDSWDPCDWFASDTWLRAKLDCSYNDDVAQVIIDYKTGKVRPENVDQLDLYAPVAFCHAPDHINVIHASLWYLDWGEEVARSYTRGEALKLRTKWVKRSKKMLSDTAFKPTPGNACRWCHFKKSNGGPCKF